MNAIILLILLFVFLFVIELLWNNEKIKQQHLQKMEQLMEVFKTVSSTHETLHQKASLLQEFQGHYKSFVKKLSEEIVVFQKMLLELLSKR